MSASNSAAEARAFKSKYRELFGANIESLLEHIYRALQSKYVVLFSEERICCQVNSAFYRTRFIDSRSSQ